MVLDVENTQGGFDVSQAYVQHGRALFGFALNGVGDRGLAEDCVQETFVRAWRAKDRYQAQTATERTWLFAIARHVMIDALRARARRPRLVQPDEDQVDPQAVVVDGQVNDRMMLLSGLAQISEEHREVIVAVQLEGMTYLQLAERTGVAVPTLRTRMYYGLRALREILREADDHE